VVEVSVQLYKDVLDFLEEDSVAFPDAVMVVFARTTPVPALTAIVALLAEEEEVFLGLHL